MFNAKHIIGLASIKLYVCRNRGAGQVSRVPARGAVSVPGAEERPGHHLRERGDGAAQECHRQHEEVQEEAGLHGNNTIKNLFSTETYILQKQTITK